jgi:transposase
MKVMGVDLHSDSFEVGTCRFDTKNMKIKVKLSKYKLEEKSFEEFKATLSPEDYILIESSTNAFWFHNQVAEYVKTCYVFNTNKARSEGNKTDKIDTRKLTKKLAYFIFTGKEEGELPTVYVPSKEIQELRGLFTTYSLYQKMIVQLRNRIHSIAKENGICLDRNKLRTKKAAEYVYNLKLPDSWKEQINQLWKDHQVITSSQAEITDKILITGNDLFQEEIKLLLGIKGFSAFTAIALMSDICTVDRFASAKKFCAYLRTAPKIKASNKKTHIGKINKQSRTRTVTLLTQSIKHLADAGEHMNDFYQRVKTGKSNGKARIALIRKILVSAYHMLKKKEHYYWIDEEKYKKKLLKYEKEIYRIKEKKKILKIA